MIDKKNTLKKIILILVLLISVNVCAKENEAKRFIKILPLDTMVLPSILSLNLNYYIGKPVDSLLAALPATYTLRGFMVARHGYSKGVIQAYSTNEINDCHVEIYIDKFQYQVFPNYKKPTWSMILARKETISFIRVMKRNNSICLYGCNDLKYHYLD